MNYFELLSMAEDYKVEKNGEVYGNNTDDLSRTGDSTTNLEIVKETIEEDEGVYNSGCNYIEIDIDKILKLRKFCEMVVNCK